jgi:hypothetical protein
MDNISNIREWIKPIDFDNLTVKVDVINSIGSIELQVFYRDNEVANDYSIANREIASRIVIAYLISKINNNSEYKDNINIPISNSDMINVWNVSINDLLSRDQLYFIEQYKNPSKGFINNYLKAMLKNYLIDSNVNKYSELNDKLKFGLISNLKNQLSIFQKRVDIDIELSDLVKV